MTALLFEQPSLCNGDKAVQPKTIKPKRKSRRVLNEATRAETGIPLS
jgi:hypothetical protein